RMGRGIPFLVEIIKEGLQFFQFPFFLFRFFVEFGSSNQGSPLHIRKLIKATRPLQNIRNPFISFFKGKSSWIVDLSLDLYQHFPLKPDVLTDKYMVKRCERDFFILRSQP